LVEQRLLPLARDDRSIPELVRRPDGGEVRVEELDDVLVEKLDAALPWPSDALGR
jgi:hypothetical protein